MASRETVDGRQRRWAGPFRVCAGCQKRNFVGRVVCASCGASLRGAPLPQPPEAGILTGRRTADRLTGRGVWIGIAAAALLATALGLYVKRTFQTGRWALTGDPTAAATLPAPIRAVREEPPEPDFPSVEDRAGFQKGRRLLAAGDAKGALAPLSNAVRALPNDAAVAHEYGTALVQAGEEDRGLFHLEHAARLAPGIVSYRVDLARALAAAGRRGHAVRELEAVLRSEPGHVQAAAALAGLGAPSAAPLASPGSVASPGSGGSTDMGGAARDPDPRPSTGTAFTNEDLDRRRGGPPPSDPPAPVASPSPAG